MPITVLNMRNELSIFSADHVAGTLVRSGLDGPSAVARADTLGAIIASSGVTQVSTRSIRFGLGELAIHPTAPDAALIGDNLRSERLGLDGFTVPPERLARFDLDIHSIAGAIGSR